MHAHTHKHTHTQTHEQTQWICGWLRFQMQEVSSPDFLWGRGPPGSGLWGGLWCVCVCVCVQRLMCVCSLSCRELSHPPPLLPPQAAPHITLGAHLRPPFLGMPSALCPAPGESAPHTGTATGIS